MSDYRTMPTKQLLRLLISRDARKIHHQGGSSYHPFSDSYDEWMLDSILDELEERIDRSAVQNESSHGITIGG